MSVEEITEKLPSALAEFHSAAQAWHDAMGRIRDNEQANLALWADGTRRTAYDRYYDLVAATSQEAVAEVAPALAKEVAAIELESVSFGNKRNDLSNAASDARSYALTALGAYVGLLAAQEIAADPGALVAEMNVRLCQLASRLRHEFIDKGDLTHMSDGPFTRAMIKEIARAKGLRVNKGRRWEVALYDGIGQPIYGIIEGKPESLRAFESTCRSDLWFQHEDSASDDDAGARLSFALRDPWEISDLLAKFVEHDIKLVSSCVRDPYFRGRIDPKIVTDLSSLDDLELACEREYARWLRGSTRDEMQKNRESLDAIIAEQEARSATVTLTC